MVKTRRQASRFNFVDLPVEVRAIVLRYASTEEIHVATARNYKPGCPSLLLVSKAFAAEAQPCLLKNAPVIVDVYRSGTWTMAPGTVHHECDESIDVGIWTQQFLCMMKYENSILDLRSQFCGSFGRGNPGITASPEKLAEILHAIARFDTQASFRNRRLTIWVSQGHLMFLDETAESSPYPRADPDVYTVLRILTASNYPAIKGAGFEVSRTEGDEETTSIVEEEVAHLERYPLPSPGRRFSQCELKALLAGLCTRGEVDPGRFICNTPATYGNTKGPE